MKGKMWKIGVCLGVRIEKVVNDPAVASAAGLAAVVAALVAGAATVAMAVAGTPRPGAETTNSKKQKRESRLMEKGDTGTYGLDGLRGNECLSSPKRTGKLKYKENEASLCLSAPLAKSLSLSLLSSPRGRRANKNKAPK
jgi:hypothetical protein